MNEPPMKLVPILPEVDSSNFKELLALPGKKLIRIWAISAYYDHESIKQLIELGKEGNKSADLELIIVLDRRARADEDLKKLDEEIRGQFHSDYSGIYLSSCGQLFHSKGYLVESEQVGKCAVGSLNLTQNGLKKNAELLAFFDYEIGSQSYASKFAEHFKEYVEKIWEHVHLHSVSEESGTPSRTRYYLRDFFLEGKLYYEAKESWPFGFKLHLPKDYLIDQSDISEYLEEKTSDILDVRKLRSDGAGTEEKENSGKSSWKRYCFQTCYGYWSPDCHFEGEGIEKEIQKKKDRIKTYKNTFDTLGKENSKELFDKLLEICRDIAPKVGESWKFRSKDSQDLNESMLRQKWSDWFRKLMKKNQEVVISRLCGGVQTVSMPDIWEDGEAVKKFVDSFKQSFLYELDHKNKSLNKLFHLLWKCGARDDNSLEEAIQKLMQTKQARLPDSQA